MPGNATNYGHVGRVCYNGCTDVAIPPPNSTIRQKRCWWPRAACQWTLHAQWSGQWCGVEEKVWVGLLAVVQTLVEPPARHPNGAGNHTNDRVCVTQTLTWADGRVPVAPTGAHGRVHITRKIRRHQGCNVRMTMGRYAETEFGTPCDRYMAGNCANVSKSTRTTDGPIVRGAPTTHGLGHVLLTTGGSGHNGFHHCTARPPTVSHRTQPGTMRGLWTGGIRNGRTCL